MDIKIKKSILSSPAEFTCKYIYGEDYFLEIRWAFTDNKKKCSQNPEPWLLSSSMNTYEERLFIENMRDKNSEIYKALISSVKILSKKGTEEIHPSFYKHSFIKKIQIEAQSSQEFLATVNFNGCFLLQKGGDGIWSFPDPLDSNVNFPIIQSLIKNSPVSIDLLLKKSGIYNCKTKECFESIRAIKLWKNDESAIFK